MLKLHMPHARYYHLLDLEPDAGHDEIKKAYRAAAKKNHPDLFPDHLKPVQQLKMMKLNEAYMIILTGEGQDEEFQRASAARSSVVNNEFTKADASRGIKTHSDPAYAYYNVAFKYMTRAREYLNSRALKESSAFVTRLSADRGVIRAALAALQEFEQSMTYFIKVLEDYPDSMWTASASDNIEKIARFNGLYQKICESITARALD